MTLEEMKEELEANGYVVHNKNHPRAKAIRRTENLRSAIRKYMWGKHYKYHFNCAYEQTRMYIRSRMITMFKYKNYVDIPEDEWPEIEEKLIEEAKKYVDKKIEKGEF